MFTTNYNDSPREKVQGNWKCSSCGTGISELPFAPTGDRPIYCKECWAKNKPQASAQDRPTRPMVQGNWKCSTCGTEISQLPFEPAPDRPIYCLDCWKKNRPPKQY